MKKNPVKGKRETGQCSKELRGWKTNCDKGKCTTIVRRFVGGLVFIATLYYFYSFVFLPSMDPEHAAFWALVASTMFGYLCGFSGYEWVLSKLLDIVSKRK